MAFLIGEYECTLDIKQRIKVPAGLLSQLTADDAGKLVITRGIDKCLYLYPQSEFHVEMDKISRIPDYSAENREYIDQFYSGTSLLSVDSAERILIPRLHIQHAAVVKDIILICQKNKIALWALEKYKEKYMNMTPERYQELSEKVRSTYNL
jgi:MraZ protein